MMKRLVLLLPLTLLACATPEQAPSDGATQIEGKLLPKAFKVPAYVEMCRQTPDSILCENGEAL